MIENPSFYEEIKFDVASKENQTQQNIPTTHSSNVIFNII